MGIKEDDLSKIRFEYYHDLLKDLFKARFYLSTRLDIIYLALFIINVTYFSRLDSPNTYNQVGVVLSIIALFLHVVGIIYYANKHNNEVIYVEDALRKSLDDAQEFEAVRFAQPTKRKSVRVDLLMRVLVAVMLFASLYLLTK